MLTLGQGSFHISMYQLSLVTTGLDSSGVSTAFAIAKRVAAITLCSITDEGPFQSGIARSRHRTFLGNASSLGLLARDARRMILLMGLVAPIPSLAQNSLPPTSASESSSTPNASSEKHKGTRPRLPDDLDLRRSDGTPLPAELREKILRMLEDDPDLKAVSVLPDGSVVKKSVEDAEIIVSARKARGSPPGDPLPIRSLNAIDVRAFGATTVGDLIKLVSNDADEQTGSGGSIVLLNGRRPSSLEEIALFPSEAIERVDVFTPELALQYGFAPSAKVVNIVTFASFTQHSGRLGIRQPTSGAGRRDTAQVQKLHIAGDSRFNAGLTLERSGTILANDRGVIENGVDGERTSSRVLSPKGFQLGGGAGIAGLLDNSILYSLRAGLELDDSEQQLSTIPDEISLRRRSRSLSLASVLSGTIGRWQWSNIATLRSRLIRTEVYGEAVPANYSASGRAYIRSISTDLSVAGNLANGRAGPVSLALRSAYDAQSFAVTGSGITDVEMSRVSRNLATASANLTLPLLNRRTASDFGLGDMTLSGQLRLQSSTGRSAYFGGGGSLYWAPNDQLRIYLSRDSELVAPSLEQIGAPTVSVPNALLYDFSRGETVEVQQFSGGNPGLLEERRHALNANVVLQPLRDKSLNFNVRYTSILVRDRIVTPLLVSEELTSSFPDRFARSASGTLERVDQRPLNLFKTHEKRVIWGIDWISPIGRSPLAGDLVIGPSSGGPPPPGLLPPNTRIIDAPPGTPLPPEIESALSRMYFGLNHRWRLEDTAVLREGGPPLDLLNSFALNLFAPAKRHEVVFTAGMFRRGLGIKTELTWSSARTISSPLDDKSLTFDSTTKVDLQFVFNPQDRIVGTVPEWLIGVQLVARLSNLLNSSPVVRDSSERTPEGLQTAYLDPEGRFFEISVRKIF